MKKLPEAYWVCYKYSVHLRETFLETLFKVRNVFCLFDCLLAQGHVRHCFHCMEITMVAYRYLQN